MTSESGNKQSRTQRLEAALRENLKRRKAQVRGRASAPPAAESPPAEQKPRTDDRDGDAGSGES